MHLRGREGRLQVTARYDGGMRIADRARYDLTGRWIGVYGPHGAEHVEVVHQAGRVVATKITGDANVPAGEVTFEAELLWRRGRGRGRVADTGFVGARWIPGRLAVLDADHFVFEWDGTGSVLFTRPHTVQPMDRS